MSPSQGLQLGRLKLLYQDFQQPNPPFIIHAANFDLEDRVSIVSDPHPPAEAIYTDSSHPEGKAGCAFCVIQNNVQIHQWTTTLSPHNTEFQAETLAIKKDINWASSKGISISIWSDSDSALRGIFCFKRSNPLIQETKQALLQHPSMQLNWIKALEGYLGNEVADNLDKQATKEGTHLHLQTPKCHLKKVLMNLSLNKWQQDWDLGDTGRAIFNVLPKAALTPASWLREFILFGPFPIYFYRFRFHHSDISTCGEKRDPIHNVTSCPMTLSYHFTKPSVENTQLLWKSVLSNKLSRINIVKLIAFLTENENLIK
ncbi:hypothetical protein AVEN_52906-1 [Araneus ventricosus]|uniref:RNase H type-1 domain-containing protein n=1 Tax=Araneus ventricosus TaxID=182803 RepID=A0A4Y2FFX1_ARAVE|nr:hypothetical protein AVEN_52906-1 [Araneus ventricosus]